MGHYTGELPAFVEALERFSGAETTRLGIKLLLLTGVRAGELRAATVAQFDLDALLWSVPAEGVKQFRRRVRSKGLDIPPYLVPFSSQAVEAVSTLIGLQGRSQQYLLAHRSDPFKMISENTLNGAIRQMGYIGRLTGHGIRGTISTALNERGYKSEWIEARLSHADPNQVRGAYNHTLHVEQRPQMMQEWADSLDEFI